MVPIYFLIKEIIFDYLIASVVPHDVICASSLLMTVCLFGLFLIATLEANLCANSFVFEAQNVKMIARRM